MSRSLFSVIVPIYNIENYLEKCVDSILGQTYEDLEIILVDDGSTDNCTKICDVYKERDARVVVLHKPNGGLVSARQAGIRVATGEYVAYVDGDDWIEACYFERFAEALESKKYDVLCCSYYQTDEVNFQHFGWKIKTGAYSRAEMEREIFPLLIEDENSNYFIHSIWGKVFKREKLMPIVLGVNQKIAIGEDVVAVKPYISKAESLYILDEPLYFYRYNPASMTKARKPYDWNAPMMCGQQLEYSMDVTVFDFQDQIYRFVTHLLFNVAVTQFNAKKDYASIKCDILSHLDNEYYKIAIHNSKFKGWKGKLAKLTLKYKLIFLIKLYHRIK